MLNNPSVGVTRLEVTSAAAWAAGAMPHKIDRPIHTQVEETTRREK